MAIHLSPSNAVKIGFEPMRCMVPMSEISYQRTLSNNTRESRKYAQIANSISKVGLIEPLVIARRNEGGFMLLDGRIRFDILTLNGALDVECIIATDDEAFTYNRHVNHLPVVQEHRMILRAIDKGLSPEQIADALHIDVTSIREKRRLLDGICSEVVEMLKDRHVAIHIFRVLKKMKALRQIQVVEAMLTVDRLTVPYAKAMLAATSPEDLVSGDAKAQSLGLKKRKIEVMERESAQLEREFKLADKSFARVNMQLILAKGYTRRIMECVPVLQYLIDHHRDLTGELRQICRPSGRL